MRRKYILMATTTIIFLGLFSSCKKKEYWPKKSEKTITPLTKSIDLNFETKYNYSSIEKTKVYGNDLWILQKIQEEKKGNFYDQIEYRTTDTKNIIYKSSKNTAIIDFLLPKFNQNEENKENKFFLVLDQFGIKKYALYSNLLIDSFDFGFDQCPIKSGNMLDINNILYVNFISCDKNYLYSIFLDKNIQSTLEMQEQLLLANIYKEHPLDFSQIFYDEKLKDEIIINYNFYHDQRIHFSIFKLVDEFGIPRIQEYTLENKTSFIPIKSAYDNKTLYIVGSKTNSNGATNDFNINLITLDLNLLKVSMQQEYHLGTFDDFPTDIIILKNKTIGIGGIMNLEKENYSNSGDGFFLHIDEKGKILSQKGLGFPKGQDSIKTLSQWNEKIIYMGGVVQANKAFIQFSVLENLEKQRF